MKKAAWFIALALAMALAVTLPSTSPVSAQATYHEQQVPRRFPTGTAAEPSVSDTGYPTTGVYFQCSGANSIGFSLSATSRWCLSSAGLVSNGSVFSAPTLINTGSSITAGTMTVGYGARSLAVWHKYSWTNAMVAALTGTADDITVGTLPAKTLARRAFIVITGQGVQGAGTYTVAVGTVATTYLDYVKAGDAKAAVGTMYGDAAAEVGTALYEGTNHTYLDHLPSMSTTTAVKAHFIAVGANLSTVTASTGDVYIETLTLP
jgi:hypothetical protein